MSSVHGKGYKSCFTFVGTLALSNIKCVPRLLSLALGVMIVCHYVSCICMCDQRGVNLLIIGIMEQRNRPAYYRKTTVSCDFRNNRGNMSTDYRNTGTKIGL